MRDTVAAISSNNSMKTGYGVAQKIIDGEWTGFSEWLEKFRDKTNDNYKRVNQIIDSIEDAIGLESD